MIHIRRIDILFALYIFGIMVAELLGAKTFPIFTIGDFHLNSSVAIFVVPLLFSITDIVTEVHGRARARSMVYSGLLMVALLLLFCLLATSLSPSIRFATQEIAYDAIFGASIQIALASIIAFAVSELLDVAIFSKLRNRMKEKGFWLRNNVSNIIAMLVDTTLFVSIAFYSFEMTLLANAMFAIGIIVPYWLLKCVVSAFGTPLAYAGVRWLRGEKECA